jgi:hypothetical protein
VNENWGIDRRKEVKNKGGPLTFRKFFVDLLTQTLFSREISLKFDYFLIEF